MSVVSDTTAITTLPKTGDVGLLTKLFGTVIVPPAVWDELCAFILLCRISSNFDHCPEQLRPPNWRGWAAAKLKPCNWLCKSRPDWLLMDDRQARATAVKLGLRCVALTGLLIKAKQLGHVRSVREWLDRLERRGGLYLSEAVKEEALRQAGE